MSLYFCLSPDSIKNEVFNCEVDWAVKNGKRMIPVVCRDVDYREVRKEFASFNWIFFRPDGDDFNAAMKLLLKAVDQDKRQTKYHTKYLNNAIKWERHDHSSRLVLKDKSVTDMEALQESICAVKIEGLKWLGEGNFVPTCFAMSKLTIMCQIFDEKVPNTQAIYDAPEELECVGSTRENAS